MYVSQGDQSIKNHSHLQCDGFNFITYRPKQNQFRCTARIRHRQPEQDATAILRGNGLELVFDKPQRAIAEGQYAVVYVDNVCLGGGVIERKFWQSQLWFCLGMLNVFSTETQWNEEISFFLTLWDLSAASKVPYMTSMRHFILTVIYFSLNNLFQFVNLSWQNVYTYL